MIFFIYYVTTFWTFFACH